MSGERRDLLERTKRYALQIIQLYSLLPKTIPAQVIGRQILRSGTSPGAQYREAQRAKSTADFISKVEGALQELDETGYWLELLISSGTIGAGELLELVAETQELIAIFVAVVNSARRAGKKHKAEG